MGGYKGSDLPLHKLTQKQVDNAKPGRHSDGGGLFLVVSQSISKKWTLKYTLRGKRPEMGLGKYPTVSLKLAREKAGEYRGIAYSGSDPIDFRDTPRKGSIVFQECAANYIEKQRPAWKSSKHLQQWQNTLATYVYPVFGDKPVNLISDEDVRRVLDPIWIEKHETASRVRGRIEAILEYASALKHRESENPARMKGHLQNILVKRASGKQQKHHPAMPYKE